MSFDSHSLEKLQEIRRQLPKKLPSPNSTRNTTSDTEKRHIVETEENPEKLFKELMKISKDGNVPPHLLTRLKEIEAKYPYKKHVQSTSPGESSSRSTKRSQAKSQKHKSPETKKENQLYVDFKRLLLENEEEC